MAEVLPGLREPIGHEILDAHRTVALIHVAVPAGEVEEAREGLRRAGSAGFDHLRRGRFALLELTRLAATAARLRDKESAALLSPVLASWSPRFVYGGGAMWGHLHHHLGVLLAMLDDPRADWLLRSAEEAHRGARAPAWVARSLAQRGRHDEAAEVAATLGLAGLDRGAAQAPLTVTLGAPRPRSRPRPRGHPRWRRPPHAGAGRTRRCAGCRRPRAARPRTRACVRPG
ncbi:hypothetical protein [Nocardioides sp. B-3]|uniref:hypothetical protein n=1 Tax=Nocardioides sp. B-3 TaxID=2895565 RepID=UPI0021528C0D|nr:hypothetical protein [Nocardioides sp. B-3]UUZ60500.1 hypothetical protein LP418_06405 [Nocardioides sp. B-3]